MSTTIRDVARKARVSAGTVSRVLNGHPSVRADRMQRVLHAVEKLNYKPRHRKATMSAVNPLEHKSVLLLLLGMDHSLARLPVVASAIHGVEAALADARANLLIADVPNVDHVPESLERNRIDAVILKGALQGDWATRTGKELFERLGQLPLVWFLGRPLGCAGDVIHVNDMLVGQMAAQYLVERGHHQLGFVSPKPKHVALMRRQASFTYFAEQAGASVQAFLGREDDWRIPYPAVDHVECVQGLVDKLLVVRKRPTAIFAPDDGVGAMVYRALAQRGLQVGKDLSVISCNNDRPLLMGLYPAPTTIDVHAEQIGRRAVAQLAWRIAHRNEIAVEIGLEPTLVEGESVVTLNA